MTNLRNIFALKDLPGFDDKPWLIVGSGPSIRKFQSLEPIYNILCINNSVVYTKYADIVLCRDPQMFTIDKILEQKFECKAFVTDYINRFFEFGNLADKLYFISYFCSNEFCENIPVFPSSSSSPTAFLILATLGCKKIYSIGLDGSIGRIPELVTSEHVQNMNYELHNEPLNHYARGFGIEWIKL